MTHKLKIHPQYFKSLILDLKKVEIRKDDRNYQIGDLLVLNEFDPVTEKYTGSQVKRVIDYILKDVPGLIEGYVLLQISKYNINETTRSTL